MGKKTQKPGGDPQGKLGDSISSEGRMMELRLRALHDLIPAAHDFPGFAVPYMSFLRSLRERLHPIGVRDVRVFETPSGLKFNVDLGERLGSDFYYGYYGELFESELFMRLLEPGTTVVDVGANFGYYAVSAAAKVGPRGSVHAFEPDPAAFELLLANVEGTGLGNVRCHHVCVGAEDGETDFHVMEESAFSGITPTGRARLRERITMGIRSLDSILSEAAVPFVAAIKIDVEGHEFAVLRGSRETIRRSHGLVLMVEVNAKNLDPDRRAALESALRDLQSDGFGGWVPDFGAEGLRPVRELQDTAALGSANLFLVRSGTATEERLRATAKEIRAEAFRGVAKALGVDSQQLLRGNAADPHHGLNLHAALISSALRDREARIETLTVRLNAVEQDSQARLGEIRKRDERLDAAAHDRERLQHEVAQHDERLDAAARDRERLQHELAQHDERLDAAARDRERLQHELAQRDEHLQAAARDRERLQHEVAQRDEHLQALADRLDAIEQDSQARLGEIRKRDERLEATAREQERLQEELEYWKREAMLGIQSRVWRWIRRAFLREGRV